MFGFLFIRSRQKEKENKVKNNIITKLDRIIELLEQQQKNKSMENIHIDHVQIDHLENIVFRLDSIEIDELSGKLVIGNNINAASDLAGSLNLKLEQENVKKETMSLNTPLNKKVVKKPKRFLLHYDLRSSRN